jgi:hypothetical protein
LAVKSLKAVWWSSLGVAFLFTELMVVAPSNKMCGGVAQHQCSTDALRHNQRTVSKAECTPANSTSQIPAERIMKMAVSNDPIVGFTLAVVAIISVGVVFVVTCRRAIDYVDTIFSRRRRQKQRKARKTIRTFSLNGDVQPDFVNLVEKLSGWFNRLEPPVETATMRMYFAEQKYTELVGEIKKSMNLDMQLRVGYVSSGGPSDAPAWIMIPNQMPPFGTERFKELQLTMYLRKEFVQEMPFEVVATAIAHELSHVVLEATGHPMRKFEQMVDLTAMVLGYAEIYVLGITHKITENNYITTRKFGDYILDEPKTIGDIRIT